MIRTRIWEGMKECAIAPYYVGQYRTPDGFWINCTAEYKTEALAAAALRDWREEESE